MGDFSDLLDRKRPSIALIKLIEATGILLGIPKSFTKSKYKAPIPTNYDATIQHISDNFYGCVDELIRITSESIPNDIGSELYAKTLEPGFDYEGAVIDGGLSMRDLFNAVVLVLTSLQEDLYRLPTKITNVLVLVDGSRSSYVALDAATHIYNHGMISVLPLCNEREELIDEAQPTVNYLRAHLHEDLIRRCKLQYKLPEYCYQVRTIESKVRDSVIENIKEEIKATGSKILVLGLDDWNLGLDSRATLLLWAAWECPISVVLAKGRSKIRPFSVVNMPRIFQLCVKIDTDIDNLIMKFTAFMRPGDFVVVVAIVETRDAKGDHRDSRFDFGKRSQWINGPKPSRPTFSLGWNDEEVSNLQISIEKILFKAQLQGKARVERLSTTRTIAQELCLIAVEESIDLLVLKTNNQRQVIVECAQESPCSIIIIK